MNSQGYLYRALAPRLGQPVRRSVWLGVVVIANLLAGCVALVLVTVAIPEPNIFDQNVAWIVKVVVPLYVAVALVVGWTWVTKGILNKLRWRDDGQPLTAEDQRNALLAPWRLIRIALVLWSIGAILFALLYGMVSYRYIPKLVFGMGVGGAVLTASCYFFGELLLRPAAAVALAEGPPAGRLVPGVMGRATMSWILGSGVPLLVIVVVAAFGLSSPGMPMSQVDSAVVLLSGAGFIFGFASNVSAAWLTATSIRAVQSGLQCVKAGDLDCDVEVFDSSELGELQRGFNAMVAGLRQHERIRDLFGRYVGRDVAAVAEAQDVVLGGDECHVAVLFVDIVGSTDLVSARPPAEAVALLNRFFRAIVDDVDRRGGLINKFEGDAALAVFGAPVRLASPETCALTAARALVDRLVEEVPECQAGIGVAAGRVVAGNVGADERFEYTVIGEAVNVAARLCEMAKSQPHRVLASAAAVQASDVDEQRFWKLGKPTLLRGHDQPIQVATLAADMHRYNCATRHLPRRAECRR